MSTPHRSGNIIGRSRDLETIAGLLKRERLVTILGPPGIGKTRFAERYLELQSARTDGQVAVFCDLTDATCVDDICRLVARALDVSTVNGDSGVIVEQLGRAMAGRSPMVLVLDNFEQIVGCAAATVAAWLRLAPDTRILVASRERLNLAAEVLFDLGPLSLPEEGGDSRASEAVQLFVERARAVAHDYVLTDGELPTVATLARQFDGNPLAIELASARMRVLTSAEILASLGLDVLAGNAADAPARHASLRQAIAWSWGSLKPWEQAALGQCSVFQGGFGVGAAQAVLDLSPYPGAPTHVAVLEALCNKSLLLRYRVPEEPQRTRFRLYVGIQEFGREKLVERGEREATEARHAQHLLAEGRALAVAVEGPSGVEALRRLVVETENLLAVHRRALGRVPQSGQTATEAMGAAVVLQRMLLWRGPFSLLFSLLDGALGASHVSEVVAPLRAAAQLARGRARRAVGRASDAQADFEQALALAEGVSDASLAGEILVSLGGLHVYCSRASDAAACFARAVGTGDPRAKRLAHASLALLRKHQGRHGEAIELLKEAVNLHREGGDLLQETLTILNLAGLKGQSGLLEEACTDIERAFTTLTAFGLRRPSVLALGIWGVLEHARGHFEAAEPLYERAQLIFQGLDEPRGEGMGFAYQGLLHDAMGRLGEARDCCEKALSVLGGSGHPIEALALATLAGLDAAAGRLTEARARYDAAERGTFHDAGVPSMFWVMRGHLDLALARAALAAGDLRSAAMHEQSARRRARCAPGTTASSDAGSVEPIWLGLDARIAQISVERALSRHAANRPPERESLSGAPENAEAPLVISLAHRWFQPPGGERVSLVSRRALSRLLGALAEQWAREPGGSLSIDALLRLGWPNEKMSTEAGNTRVYHAIYLLRQLGLAGVIAQHGEGYMLSSDARIQVIDAPPSRP
jgi:predicted ATPase